jgi:hypothetical protein
MEGMPMKVLVAIVVAMIVLLIFFSLYAILGDNLMFWSKENNNKVAETRDAIASSKASPDIKIPFIG